MKRKEIEAIRGQFIHGQELEPFGGDHQRYKETYFTAFRQIFHW
jgi:hypothetical protein